MTIEPREARWWQTRGGVALIGFGVIAGFFLLTEHTAHVFGALPYLLLLACPLLHFLHGGHGRHDRHDGSSSPGADSERDA